MFIAHLPAGYLLSKYFKSKSTEYKLSWNMFVLIGLMGSILPDLDLFYFYLVDERQHQHHSYWSHIPIFWLSIYVFTASIFIVIQNKKMVLITTFIFAQIILHLILDTVSGGILWGYPLSIQYFVLFNVTPQYNWWVFNFILHWSFALEAAIILFALTTYMDLKSKINNESEILRNE